MNPEQPLVSVVIPLLNEQEIIDATLSEVSAVLEGLATNYEIVVVDDGSTDGTFAQLKRSNEANPRIKGVRLSRHFGKEAAVLAGMSRARGQAVVTMDGDLQHPPAVIPDMLAKWREGAQVVHGVKSTRKHGGILHRTASRIFNSMFSRIAGFSIVNSSDFKLLDANVARLLVQDFSEQQRFHRGLSIWVGFRQESVQFTVPERQAGASHWPLWGLFRYGWNALTSFTSLPLQLVPLLGLVMLLASLLLGTEALISRLNGHSISGFATLEITLLFSGSMIMIGLGIVGQYLARIYEEVKKRPVYLVEESVGFKRDG
jgi:glycosyltransferase involved in cell wall biosynthesis